MKAYMGILALALVATLPAIAQRPGGGHPAAPPAHGPSEFHGTPAPAQDHRNYSDKTGHPNAPHVDGNKWVGHDTGKNDPTIIWIIRGSMDISPAGLDRIITGGWPVAALGASGSVGSTSA